MVYFKEDYIFQGSRGDLTFSRVGGPIFSKGCGDQMLISIEIYRIYVFQGGPDLISFLWIRAYV